MMLSASTLACPNWSLPQIVGAASAYGLDGIDVRGIGPEIDITRLAIFDSELPATLELLHRHNLRLPCLNTSIALVTPAAERWDMMLDECHRYARLAGRVDARYLRIFGGSVPRGMTRAEAATMARRHLRQLVKLCAPHQCQVLLETHDQWATSAQALELLAEFSPDEAGAVWDIEHPFSAGETPSQTAASLGSYLRHVHLKDLTRHRGRNVPCLLGQGDLPVHQTLGALLEAGYAGWICLETEKRWHPQDAPEPEQSLPQFVQFMHEHWRRTAPPPAGRDRAAP